MPGDDFSTQYYQALSLFSQQKYEEASKIYRQITAGTSFSESTRRFYEKSFFELGRCELHLENLDAALDAFGEIIRKHQRSDHYKECIFYAASCFEKKGNVDKAKGFYAKVAAMNPTYESINKRAKKALEKLQKKAG